MPHYSNRHHICHYQCYNKCDSYSYVVNLAIIIYPTIALQGPATKALKQRVTIFLITERLGCRKIPNSHYEFNGVHLSKPSRFSKLASYLAIASLICHSCIANQLITEVYMILLHHQLANSVANVIISKNPESIPS